MTPSATSENNWGVVRLIANLPFCRRFLRPPSTEAPSLRRSYPASSVLRASPPSQSARPFSRELPVDPHRDHRWDFSCCVWSPLLACRRQYPGQVGWKFIRSCNSIRFGLPRNRGGSAPALVFSRPAQRSLTLRPARSPSRLATLCTEGFSSFVASAAASIATGWNEPVPGRVYPRCGPPPFHGAPGDATYQDLHRNVIEIEVRIVLRCWSPTRLSYVYRMRIQHPTMRLEPVESVQGHAFRQFKKGGRGKWTQERHYVPWYFHSAVL